MYNLLISAPELVALQAASTRLMTFDCSFDLTNVAAGEEQYRKAHIPGAVYANLNTALSDLGVLGLDGRRHPHLDAASGGRHPLPSREKFSAWLSSIGFANDMQAVVYDRNGATYCGRLWWMLKWVGHDAVAVLDGGLQAWQRHHQARGHSDGNVTDRAEPSHFQSNFVPGRELRALMATETVAANLGSHRQTLIDARAPARFRGEVEPLDRVAGHIPGALNRPFSQNFDADGKFKAADLLRSEFEQLLSGSDPKAVVHYCGSGVSALPNLIAMEIAGLPAASLYAGSWSEWSTEPARPIQQG